MQKVLVVEDDPNIGQLYQDMLAGKFSVCLVASFLEAEKKIESINEFSIVVMDGWLDQSCTVGTVPLVKKIREVNKNIPIIAASGSVSHRALLMQAGCNLVVQNKSDVPFRIRGLIG